MGNKTASEIPDSNKRQQLTKFPISDEFMKIKCEISHQFHLFTNIAYPAYFALCFANRLRVLHRVSKT